MRLYFFLFFLCLICLFAKAQEFPKDIQESTFSPETSRKNIEVSGPVNTSDYYLELGNHYYDISIIDSALMFYEKGLQISLENEEYVNVVQFYIQMGSVFDDYGDFEKAKNMVSHAVSKAIEIRDFSGIGTALNLLGSILFRYGEYKEALQSFYYSLQIKQNSGDYIGASSVLNNIANIYYTWSDYEMARTLQMKSLHILRSQRDSTELSGVLLNLGNSYLSLENYDSAIYYYDSAIELAKYQGNELRWIGGTNNKAYLLIAMGQFQEAKLMLNEVVQLPGISQYKMEYIYILRNLGEVHLRTNDYGNALMYLNRSAHLADSIGLIDLYISLLELKSEAYEKTGQFELALESYRNSRMLNDSIFSAEVRRNIYDYQVKYEMQREESQLLMKDLQILKHKSQVRSQLYILISLGLIVIVGSLIIWIFVRNREKIRTKSFQQQIIRFQQQALSAQMNPHFVSNSLNSIQRFYLQNDYETATDYLSEFGALIRIILENSSKEAVTVDEEVKFIRTYLKLEHLRLEKKFNFHIYIHPDVNQLKTYIPPLILQPYVENAVWHGIAPLKSDVKPQLLVSFHIDESYLTVTIDDDGIGLEESEKLKQQFGKRRKSYAMDINSSRLNLLGQMMNGSIEPLITDKKTDGLQGTRVIIKIPLNFYTFTS